jgi:phosphoribosylformylglycinamidine synthase
MAKPRALVLTGYGINCDYETARACEQAGFEARRVHLSDALEEAGSLLDYRLLVFPGGFSFGDDLGSGVAFSSKIRFSPAAAGGRLYDYLAEFVERDGLVLGICNGFQILVRLGLIPAAAGGYGRQQVTLAPNRAGYFIDRWVELTTLSDSPCIFTRGLGRIRLPVRHGEGQLLIPKDGPGLGLIEREGLAPLRYCDESGRPTQVFPRNPNGSTAAIAGICDTSGRIFGLMPHPEAAVSLYQYPDWTGMRERARRAGRDVSERGDGLRLFENAIDYVR